ncbi:hypothetical protein RBB78_00340 [Tunturiibacter empetritectus]
MDEVPDDLLWMFLWIANDIGHASLLPAVYAATWQPVQLSDPTK